MTLTVEQVHSATGATTERAALWQPHLDAACALFLIDPPRRLAARRINGAMNGLAERLALYAAAKAVL